MSQSHSPTRAPVFSRATARLAATVDLPTPPFAARDGDDVLDSFNAGRSHARRARPGRRRMDIDQDLCLPDPGSAAQDCFRLRLDRLRNGRLVRGQRHLHGDRVAVDLDALHQTERNDIAAEARILYRLQRFLDLFLGHRHGRVS